MKVFDFVKTLPATRKLYHAHPAWTESTARVMAVKDKCIVLDQTIFYPEGGGQVSDEGTIDGIKVVGVSKLGGKTVKIMRDGLEPLWIPHGTVVVHELERQSDFAVGQLVTLQIDGAHRLACSVNHSGAHFLYAALRRFLHDKCGEEIFTKGCFIGPKGFRFDLGNVVASEDLDQVEYHMCSLLRDQAPIRMEPVGECDDVFLWKSGDLTIPCGGTHVSDTSRIGHISLRRRSKGKGTVRIEGVMTLPF